MALILSAEDVRRVLEGSTEPFAAANLEKRAALSHFQPHGVLISPGAERAERRRFNEEVLDTYRPEHRLRDDFIAKLGEEAASLVDDLRRAGRLTWDRFAVGWWRLVRRVTLGERARDDQEITDMLRRLRADANWAFLRPRRRGLLDAFLERLRAYLREPAPGSLASLAASIPSSPRTKPDDQVPQWLFAFDAAGMAAFRALALLDAHPAEAARARAEAEPFLRACLLESVRLWPTTPAILRDTTEPTSWRNVTLPAGAAIVVFAPFFHRDDERLPFADAFRPELWLDGGAAGEWALVPFSQGPAECAGRNLVLFLTSSLLARLLAQLDLRRPPEERLDAGALPPVTLSPFRLRFAGVGG